MSLSVRTAVDADIPRLLELLETMREDSAVDFQPGKQDDITQYFKGLLQYTDCLIAVLEDANQIIGFISAGLVYRLYVGEHTVMSDLMFVHPEHRSLKAATSLIHALEEWATRLNADKVLISTSTGIDLDRLMERKSYVAVGTNYERRL